MKCFECKESFRVSELTEVSEGHKFCMECRDERFGKCVICGRWIEKDNMHETQDGEVCEHCFTENYRKCKNCDESGQKNYGREVDGVFWCEDCFEENFIICENCEEIAANDESYSSENGECYCQDCYDDLYNHCCSCDAEINRDDTYYAEDSCWCDTCFNERFGECSHCNEIFRQDDLHYDDDNGEYYCDECNNGGGSSSREIKTKVIHDYGYRPEPKFKKMPWNDNLFLGIELEIQTEEGTVNEKAEEFIKFLTEERIDNDLYLKHDGSVPNGFEIVTEPITLEYSHTIMKWKRMLAYLKKKGFISHESGKCGIHIHLSKDYFTELDMKKLRLFFSGQKNPIYKFSKRDGKGDDYCQYEEWNTDNLLNGCTNDGRYWALNFASSRETIELRAFRGTLDYDRFLATIQFADAISNFVQRHGITAFIYGEGIYKNNCWKLFVDWCKASGNYLHLVKYLKEEKLCA